jgi:hypothetical protein
MAYIVTYNITAVQIGTGQISTYGSEYTLGKETGDILVDVRRYPGSSFLLCLSLIRCVLQLGNEYGNTAWIDKTSTRDIFWLIPMPIKFS